MAKAGARKTKGSKAAGDGENISGYFRKIFAENPKLLGKRSNDEIVHRWEVDHPGQKANERVRQNLSNIKSVLRKKRRKKRAKVAQPAVAAVASTVVKPSHRGLESLEEHIDDCLTAARNLDREGLESVIKLLRRARNEVVWKIGQ